MPLLFSEIRLLMIEQDWVNFYKGVFKTGICIIMLHIETNLKFKNFQDKTEEKGQLSRG